MSKERALTLLSMDRAALEVLTREFQTRWNLKVDGWPGPEVRAKIRDLQPAAPTEPPVIPKTRAEVKRVYGTFHWTSSRGRYIDIDDEWEDLNIRRFKLHTGQRRRLHRLVGDEFVTLFRRACDRSGYTPRSVQTYVPRKIKDEPDSKLSNHSWGIAIDLDPTLNRWGGKQKDGQPCPLAVHPEFLQVFRDAGWRCGADWKTGGGDWMHVERRAP